MSGVPFAKHPEPLTLTAAQRAHLAIVVRTLSRPRGDVEIAMVDEALRLLEGRP